MVESIAITMILGASPWANPSPRTAPWVVQTVERSQAKSDARAEARAEFFHSLAPAAVEQPPRLPDSFYQGQNYEQEETASLQALPWTRYISRHQNENFQKEMLWPVEGGRLSSGYGIRRGQAHEGLDIAKASGAPIRAAARGVVVFNGRIRGYGNTIVVYHGDGVATVYAHNLRNVKPLGTRVDRGETIAKMGRSGEATGYHVHFEVRKNGRPLNPLLFPLEGSPHSSDDG